MRVLMLSCNTGEGHNSTAKAIMDVLTERGVECRMEDALAFLSPRLSKFVCNWHARLYKYSPKLFDAGYKALERSNGETDENTQVYDLLALGARKLWETLTVGNYDAVVCVHIISALMMTELRKNWGSNEPCFFVSTDYSVVPMLEQCDLDGYFIPAEDQKDVFAQSGAPRDKLVPSGIPVRQMFYTHGSRAQAREDLGLPEEGTVVLLMCGSMGCGPIRKIGRDLAQRLPGEATLVAICGRNEKLYESMAGLQNDRLRVLGYTKNVADYMDAADLIVTKPGGLSATEAATKHLPMVLINAIGGCEEKNFERFLEHGYALGSREPDEVVDMAVALACDPVLREKMVRAMAEDFSVNSARVIADQVMDSAEHYILQRSQAHKRIVNRDFGHPQEERGCDTMEFMNSETRKNLARSFAGESQARTRYTVYADVARQENCEWVARVFEETADNEAAHAAQFLKMLKDLGGCADHIELNAGYPFRLGTTAENLGFAADGEQEEHTEAYPGFAEIARREGFKDAARLWMQIARIEGVHHNTFRTLEEQLLKGELTEKDAPVQWRCLHCGYTYEGIRACDPCPVCGKSAGWQEGPLEKKLMDKK